MLHHLRNCKGDKKLLLTCEICEKSFTRKSQLDNHRTLHEKEHYVCTHCSAQYARKSFYLQHIEKCRTSSQANPISRSNRRRDIVIDEVDEKEFDLSDLSMVSTQFDNKVSYSLKLLSIGSQVLILFLLLDGFDRIYKHFKTS